MPEGRKLELDELQVLLKEWELCQSNMQRHNNWAWQTGAIFIALSLAAFWALTQIPVEGILARQQYSLILFFFSLSTILIWFFFIIKRARFFIEISRKRIIEIEEELKKNLSSINPFFEKKPLLHTKIQGEDKGCKPKALHGVYLFLLIIMASWIWTLIANFFII